MIDLYKRLGVFPQATDSQISDACASCQDSELKTMCSEILLDSKRRQAYDQIHQQVSRIAQLRANLALTTAGEWERSFSDFSKVPSLEGTLLDRINRPTDSSMRPMRMKHWKLVLGIIWISVFSIIVGIVAATVPASNAGNDEALLLNLPRSSMLSHPLPESTATLTLKASPDIPHSYLKLRKKETSQIVAIVFLRSGEGVDIALPSGTYEVTLAGGSKWYGERSLFGKETYYRKLEKPVQLSNSQPQSILISKETRLLMRTRESF